MASLTDPEIEKLFSGAPQYFARSEGHFTGAPHPSVAFPWDDKLEIRDLTDHTQIEDKAWGCVTAWPHITRDVQPDTSAAAKLATEKRRAHFYPRCRERPNMLSMGGLEKGSVGYQAALELGVSDALQEGQFGFQSMGTKCRVIVEQRQKMLMSREGLRHLDETAILDHLVKNGRRYSEQHLRERRVSNELYNELFLQVLHPPTKVVDHQDPYSLSVQIQALIKVLAAPNMWIDFSHVEWRIKLGQLLWGTEDEVEDGASINTGASADELQEERYWLLLHVLLACELLVRLDAITEGDELGVEYIKPSEVLRFEKDATKSVKWSLHLARAWLENIEVVKTEQMEEPVPEVKPSGWLATLTKRMSLSHDPGIQPRQAPSPVYSIKGKHCQRQVDGLMHFAQRLKWPDIESYAAKISENCTALREGTPLPTPLTSPVSRRTYFEGSKWEQEEEYVRRNPSRRRKVSAALHPSGWLSKTYVSGLMLPGEGLCHFLMATLLENDQEAMARLGPMANLCGGFVYYGKSFWSTACIVGRVLAAGKGSAECMGWISSDVAPQGFGDGWVNIEVEDVQEDMQRINRKARLWAKTSIERESNVLGDADASMVLPADFTIPLENHYKDQLSPVIEIELRALSLWAPVDSVRTTPTEEMDVTPFSEVSQPPAIHTSPAALTFVVAKAEDEEEFEYTYTLASDVYFVTAHPCVPSQHVKIMKSPSGPTIQQVDLTSNGVAGKAASIVGHPLHKYYTYISVHLSELISKQENMLEDFLANYPTATHRPSYASAPGHAAKMLVIDCITGFQPLPQEHEIPLSPVVSRSESRSPTISDIEGPANPAANTIPSGASTAVLETAVKKMHHETRRRQFGSDMEILVRAFCAEKGWNALISRRRRGCLACAIREAGALGWKVIIRVD